MIRKRPTLESSFWPTLTLSFLRVFRPSTQQYLTCQQPKAAWMTICRSLSRKTKEYHQLYNCHCLAICQSKTRCFQLTLQPLTCLKLWTCWGSTFRRQVLHNSCHCVHCQIFSNLSEQSSKLFLSLLSLCRCCSCTFFIVWTPCRLKLALWWKVQSPSKLPTQFPAP